MNELRELADDLEIDYDRLVDLLKEDGFLNRDNSYTEDVIAGRFVNNNGGLTRRGLAHITQLALHYQ